MPSATTENGSTARAAPRNCTAVTATGSRPRSSRSCATVNVADSSSDASTRPSPPTVAPPPPPPVTSPTPASDTAKPAQATGRATAWCHSAAMTATSTGVAPISRAAWLTLVRSMPAFCSRTAPPYPAAPEPSTGSVQAARSCRAGRHEQDGGGQPEAQQREPARRQPAQRQLGQRHGRAPQQPGGGEGGDGAATVGAHVTMVGDRIRKICLFCTVAK